MTKLVFLVEKNLKKARKFGGNIGIWSGKKPSVQFTFSATDATGLYMRMNFLWNQKKEMWKLVVSDMDVEGHLIKKGKQTIKRYTGSKPYVLEFNYCWMTDAQAYEVVNKYFILPYDSLKKD